MEKVTVWYSLVNGGDGSAWLTWWPSEDKAKKAQAEESEGSDFEIGKVETYRGSNVYARSIKDPLGPEQL